MKPNQPDPERNKQLADMYADGYMNEALIAGWRSLFNEEEEK